MLSAADMDAKGLPALAYINTKRGTQGFDQGRGTHTPYVRANLEGTGDKELCDINPAL